MKVTPKRRKLARETALSNMGFTLYLEDLRVLPITPTQCLGLLASLCELIALETNRYALERRIASWQNVSTTEV